MRPIEPTPSVTIASDLVVQTSPSSPHFPELDGRRGLAALGVAVIHHLTGPLASYVFLFQNFFPAIIRSTYMVQSTWTLVVEEYFYLLISPFRGLTDFPSLGAVPPGRYRSSPALSRLSV